MYRVELLRKWAAEYEELANRLAKIESAEIPESGNSQFETNVRGPTEANLRRLRGRIEIYEATAEPIDHLKVADPSEEYDSGSRKQQ